MKTQTSHPSERDHKQYSGVYQQQGRMITDADWNALTDIERRRWAQTLLDTVASGAPRADGLALRETDSGDLLIVPGTVYVEGRRAQLRDPEPIEPRDQLDYPNAPTFPGKNLTLYADVWERSVTALEDRSLMDPGLHGADTTSRTETMLQVKWSAQDQLPPAMGNAQLALRLRHIFVGSDSCDPCASEMNLDERIGNYLFRVEVHDLQVNENGERLVTLKWSRDNGAEAHRTENYPTGFNQGNWIWEFFDRDCEKSLGLHYPGNDQPRRGKLTDEFNIPEASPNTYVRQWDGYLKFNLDTQTLVDSDEEQWQDRGTPLRTDSDPDAHGWIQIEGGVLELNSEQLEWQLHFQDRDFVPGDYWQVAVREATMASGDFVLGSEQKGELPTGVQHHYLPLGHLDDEGRLVEQTDAEQRQFHFPPLTDIRASDVGFSEQCPPLYQGADNVQEALDALCDIAAKHIAYEPPGCTHSVRERLAKTLGEDWPNLNGDDKTSVADMLDALLCHLNSNTLPHTLEDCSENLTLRAQLDLNTQTTVAETLHRLLCDTTASHIPINQNDKLCDTLRESESRTVQEALNTLCERELKAGGGCAISVAPGELEDVLQHQKPDENGLRSLHLCLKAGVHQWPNDLSLEQWDNVRVSGSGSTASVLVFTHAHKLTVRSLQLENLHIRIGEHLSIRGQHIDLERIQAQLPSSSNDQELFVPFQIADLGEGAPLLRCSLHQCRIEAESNSGMLLQRPLETCHFSNNRIKTTVVLGEQPPSELSLELMTNDQLLSALRYASPGFKSQLNAEERLGEADETALRSPSHIFLINNDIKRWRSSLEKDGEEQLKKLLAAPSSISSTDNIFGNESAFFAERIHFHNNQILQQPDTLGVSKMQLLLAGNQVIAQGNMSDPPNLGWHVSAPEELSIVTNNLLNLFDG